MNKLFRFICLSLSLLLVITALTACGKKEKGKNEKKETVKDNAADVVNVDDSTIEDNATEIDFETGEVVSEPKSNGQNSSSNNSGKNEESSNTSSQNEKTDSGNTSSAQSNTSSENDEDTESTGDGDSMSNWSPWK